MRVPSPAASTIVRLERAVIKILSNSAESIITSTGDKPMSLSLPPCYPLKRPEFKCKWVFLLMFPD
jgi:hypothetical protein